MRKTYVIQIVMYIDSVIIFGNKLFCYDRAASIIFSTSNVEAIQRFRNTYFQYQLGNENLEEYRISMLKMTKEEMYNVISC